MMNLHQSVSQEQYLIFSLGQRGLAALETLKVEEIIGIMDILDPVCSQALHVTGGLAIGDMLLPLLDLRARCEMDGHPYDERACIIIVEVEGAEGSHLVGMVVDSICV